jgi:actin-related protein 10
LLRELFFTHLGLATGYNIIVIESLLHPIKFRRALSYVLFRRFRVGSIKYALGETTPLFSLPFISTSEAKLHSTVLSVDIGFKETRVLPIYEGLAHLGKFTTGGAGAFAVFNRLRYEIYPHNQKKSIKFIDPF